MWGGRRHGREGEGERREGGERKERRKKEGGGGGKKGEEGKRRMGECTTHKYVDVPYMHSSHIC